MVSDVPKPGERTRPLVLVVDDDPAMRAILRHVLELEGCMVIEAENGESGLRKVRSKRPDLIVTDLTMPEMSGEEFAREVRAREGSDATLVVVSRRPPEVGTEELFDAILGKPVTRDELSRWIPQGREGES